MCALLRSCLEKEREALMSDLRPKYILPHLVKSGILTPEEQTFILGNKDTTLQVKELCEILPKKGITAFNCFVDALKKDDSYPWLAEQLLKHKKGAPLVALIAPIDEDEDSSDIDKLLAVGGVPFSPNYLLSRKELLQKIRDKLRGAARDRRKWISLCGMVGCGKSVLAAEAVRDTRLIKDCFQNGVYWVPVGHLDDQSSLLFRMQMFQEKLRLPTPIHTHSEATLNLTQKIQALRRYLTEAVADKKNMLVILDDVWDDTVIDSFDVGCPILVTTRDTKVLQHVSSYTDDIPISPGLTLSESKELLSKYVKSTPDLLPEEVEEIHQQFWGSPMILSLIGGMMCPHGNSVERWKRLHAKLKAEGHLTTLAGKKRQRHPSSDESRQKDLKVIIKFSVESLDEETRSFFSDFALFQEDVYIPNEVLEVLWEDDKYDVEDVLYEIAAKSLIQREKNPKRGTYAYAIHDLYLEFLKEQCKDLKGLQKKMISKYRKLCQTTGDQVKKYDYGFLPDDGYIYYFIGHHLNLSEEWHLFPEIFFDLGFVKNKVCIAGPSDLLNDYNLYKDSFIENLDEMHDFQNFIKKNAHLINQDTDIFQLALLEPPNSKVHEKAKIEVLSKPNKFYLEVCNKQLVPEYDELHITSHSKPVKCAVFSPDNTFIASAGEDTVLKVCSSSSGRELESFTGHTATINCCAFNSSGDKLISSSSDGTVKIWFINLSFLARCLSQEKKRYSFGELPGLTNRGSNKCILTFTKHRGEVLCCAFSPDDKLIVSGDNMGFTLVWDPESGCIKHTLMEDGNASAVHCCLFNCDSSIFAASSDAFIKLWDSTGNCFLVLDHEDKFVSGFCFTKNGETIFSIAGESVWQWSVRESSTPLKKFLVSANLCSCSLSPDESFLALGISPNNSIVISNIKSESEVTFLKKHKNDVNSISYSSDGSKLLSASSDCDIIIWNDISKRLATPSVRLEDNLCVKFTNELVITTSDHLNHIQVMSGNEGLLKTKSPPEGDKITACSLSNDSSQVIYGTECGAVKVFNINSGEVSQCLPSHLKQVTYIVHMKSSCSFVTCSEDHTLRIWEDPWRCVFLDGHAQLVVMCVLFARDEKLLSCSDDGTAIVWDTLKGEVIMKLNCHNNLRINYCDVSPDESILATASVDHTVKLWSANDGQALGTFLCSDCVRCCKFSPTSHFLVSGEDSGKITRWDINTNIAEHIGKHGSWVREIRFSEDAKYFVSVADSIKFWDQDGNFMQKLVLPGDLAYSLWACQDFTIFVVLHNSVLYILKSIY